MVRRKGRRGAGGAPDEPGPTPERRRKGDVERPRDTIADEQGRPARPYRTVDTLQAMLRRNTISAAMKQAGEDFRCLFMRAALEPLRAADLTRVRQPGLRPLEATASQAEARRRVWAALQALGGIASPAGSCVWHVVGCEWPLGDWARRQGWGGRPVEVHAAAGVLVGALGMLEAHFGTGARQTRDAYDFS